MSNLDLTKLKEGSLLYSPLFGDVMVTDICDNEEFCIKVCAGRYKESFTKEGYYFNKPESDTECLLFPSKECRDWNLYDFKTGTIKDISKESNTKQAVFKGDKKRAEDIIKYLEELGGNNKYNLTASNPNVYYLIGKNNIITCADESIYHLIEGSHELLTLSSKFNDKDLIWCWDDDCIYERTLKFYDSENKCTFRFNGTRNGYEYDNYEPYVGEYPEWAKEAIKTLKD